MIFGTMPKFPTSVNLSDIKRLLGSQIKTIVGSETTQNLKGVSSLTKAASGDVTFCTRTGPAGVAALESSKASVVFCLPEFASLKTTKACLILVENPRLSFVRVLSKFFSESAKSEIHPTAVVHPEAQIGPNVRIGPQCYVGKSVIGEGTHLQGQNYVYDGVTIGCFCVLKPGAVIGGDGFGYEINEQKKWEKFPHLGGVILEDHVEIGSNTCIDRGVLDDTIIRSRAKIDNLIHVAHNCDIGEDSLVIALTMLGGSVKIGKNCWIAPGTSILNGVHIGDDAFIGLGVTVTANVENDHRVTPLPSTKTKRKHSL
jgi:UDP-3-O-[3-hydroxymyristoyl] glucosamine N-acyltransferase